MRAHKIVSGASKAKPWTVRYFTPTQHEKSFALKRDAVAYGVAMDTRIRSGEFDRPESETVGVYAQRWLSQHPGKPGTKAGIRGNLKNHILPLLGEVPLTDLTREMIKDFLANPDIDTTSKRWQAIACLNSFLNEAVRDGKIPVNPALDIKLPKKRAACPDFIPPTYAQLLVIESYLSDEFKLALWLQYGLGLRIGEALAARYDNIRGNRFRVNEQVAVYTAKLGPMKKRKPGDYREMPLPEWLRQKMEEQAERLGTTTYLFPSCVIPGKHRYGTFWLQFNKGCKAAGIPEFHCHLLRHLYASKVLASGIPISNLQIFLGHGTITMTVDLYAHMMPHAVGEAKEILEADWAEFSASAM